LRGRKELDRYGAPATAAEPFITVLVRNLLKDAVDEAVKQHFKDNAETINNMVQDVVKAGIGKVVLDTLNARFSSEMYMLGQAIQNNLHR